MERKPFTALSQYFDELAIADHCETTDTSMAYEMLRLSTFHHVDISPSRIRLAAAGFYATHNEDETKCFSCGVTHRGWRAHDNPFLMHRSLSANCIHMASILADVAANEHRFMPLESLEPLDLIEGRGGPESSSRESPTCGYRSAPLPRSSCVSTSTSPPALTEQIHCNNAVLSDPHRCVPTGVTNHANHSLTSLHIDGAVHPLYSGFEERLKSFVTWPVGHCKKPEDLVTAGFFYAGYADCVRCYVCGVGLRTWEKEDDPWTEHVRWRSSCDYVTAVKGQEFVLRTLAAIGRETRKAENVFETRNEPRSSQATGMGVMDNDECRLALEMGFTEQHVKQTAEKITRTLGTLRLESLIHSMISDDKETTSKTSSSFETSQNAYAPQTAGTPVISDINTDSDLGSDDDALGLEIQSPDVNQLTSLKLNDSAGGLAEVNQTSTRVKLPPDKTTDESSSVESASLPSSAKIIEEENRELKESSLCKVCLDDPANIVFLPCGHLVTCATCSPALNRCPICRKHIRGTVRVHLANEDSVQINL